MPRRRTTCRTSSARTTNTAAARSRSGVAALAAVLILAPAPASARTDPLPPVGEVLAAYERATRADDVTTLETHGTAAGEGLSGTFHTWRQGEDERDDENLGPRKETTLRVGGRAFVSNANDNVRELTGYLKRRLRTADFVDSGAFLHAPERSRVLGWGDFEHRRVWRLEVNAEGGEPQILWIDPQSGLPLRSEVIEGDGPTYVDLSDWRTVDGRRFPFRAVTTDGDHAYDLVELTTAVIVNGPIPADVFAPLRSRVIDAPDVVTVPLIDFPDGHVGVAVTVAGTPYTFLLDSGAQNVLLDTRVARAAGLQVAGSLEVRGAGRSGGLGVARLPSLTVGAARLDGLVVSVLDLRPTTGPSLRADGILGYPFFAASQVELDFAHHRLRFGKPGSFAPAGTRVALDVDRELIEATLRLDGRIDAPFIVDTGNSGEMLLYQPFVLAHPGLAPFTTDGSLNYGIGGANRTYRTHLDTIALGGFELYARRVDVVMATRGAFADQVDAGNVGLGVLRNFVATFDLGSRAMYLARGEAFDDGRRRAATGG